MNTYGANIRRFYVFSFLFPLQLLMPIWVIYLIDDRGLSLGQVTAMEGVFWLAMLSFEIPTGLIADRFGRVTSLRAGAVANTIAMLAFAFAGNYFLLFASYLGIALALTCFSGADSAFFYDSLKAIGRQGEYQKLWGRCWALQSAGIGVSLVLGAAVAEVTSVHFTIILSGVLTVPLIAIAWALREPPRLSEGEVQAGFTYGARAALSQVWSQPQLRTIMPLAAFTVASAWIVGILAQPFLAEQDVPVGWWGALLLPGEALSIVCALVAYRVVVWLGFPRSMLILVGMTMLPLLAFASVDAVIVFAFFPFAGAIEGASQPVVSDYVNRRIPSAQRATVLSLYSFAISVIAAALIPASGVFAEAWGLQAGYWFGLAVAAALLPVLFILWFRAHRKYGTRPPVSDHDPLYEPASVAAPRAAIAVHIEEGGDATQRDV